MPLKVVFLVVFFFSFFPVVHGILHKRKPIVRVLKPEKARKVAWTAVLRLKAELLGRQTSQLQWEKPPGKTTPETHQKSLEQKSYSQKLLGWPMLGVFIVSSQAPHQITTPKTPWTPRNFCCLVFCQASIITLIRTEHSSAVSYIQSWHVLADRPNQCVILLLTIYNSISPTLLSVLLYTLMEEFYWFLRLDLCIHCVYGILRGLSCT